MNKRIVMLLAVMALVSAPALDSKAQEGPGEEEEAGMMEGGPGHPGMPPPAMEHGQAAVKTKKTMHGGPAAMSEAETLAVIRKHDEAFAKKITDLRESAPARYRILLQMAGRLLGMDKAWRDESAEKDAVRELVLEYESKELSLKYGKADEADKKVIKETLRSKTAELFDLKAKGQEQRVKHMEGEITRLKKNLETRRASKSKIVEQRVEQLSGEGYGW